MYKHFFKRLFDILISIIGLIICAIPMLIVAIAIKCDSEGPVIFKQERVGKNGKVFNIYKFRSMCVGAEKTGSGVYSGKGDARVTKVGKILYRPFVYRIRNFLWYSCNGRWRNSYECRCILARDRSKSRLR